MVWLCSSDIIVAWQAVGGAQTALTKAYPLNEHNTVAMSITSGTGRCQSARRGWGCKNCSGDVCLDC